MVRVLIFLVLSLLLVDPAPARAGGLDLGALENHVKAALQTAPASLRKRYAKLDKVLGKADRIGLADDFLKLQRVAKECAAALAEDTVLCTTMEAAIQNGVDQLESAEVDAALAIANVASETVRRRGDGSILRGRGFTQEARTALEGQDQVDACDEARHAAKTFQAAAASAARAFAAAGRKKARWQVVLRDVPGELFAVWVSPGPSPTVYAVGGDDGGGPTFLRGGPEGFVRIPVAASGDLRWVAPVPGAGVWAAGSEGRVVQYDPASGALTDVSIGQQDATLGGIWGSGPADVWVVGAATSGPVLSHWDGNAWTPASLPPEVGGTLYRIAGIASDDLYVVGSAGLLLHWDGTAWATVPSGTDSTLLAVAVGGAGGETAIAVGDIASAEIVERGPNGVWAPVPVPEDTLSVAGVFVPASGDPWACGYDGSVLRRVKGRWKRVSGVPLDSAAAHLRALHVDGEGGVWVAGGDLLYYGGRVLGPDAGLVVPRARWTETVQPFLYATCAFTACHVPPLLGAGLDMETREAAAANLPRVPSTESPLLRVVPGRPSRSYVWHKLNGTQASVGGTGTSMPQGESLMQVDLDRIRAWILEGAPVD